MKKRGKTNKIKKDWIFWTPRILTILFIVFMSMFAFDVFGEYSGLELLIAFFMHIIPSLVLIGILILAWRKEKVGGYMFITLAVLFTIFFKLYKDIIVFLIIGLPVLLTGILFLLDYYRRKK